MKKIITIILSIAVFASLIALAAVAKEDSPIEIRPTPEVVSLKSLEDNELFEIVDSFEKRPGPDSKNTASRAASISNRSLYNGFYDGRQLSDVISGGQPISAFTDISGKSIAFADDGSDTLKYSEAFAKATGISPYHFKRHLYSNGYYFITPSVIVYNQYNNEYYTGNSIYAYTFCYDTVNNILYKLPFEVGEVNEYGEAYAYVTKTERNGSSLETTCTTHSVKLKKNPIISVFYNKEKVLFDQLPVIENGRTLVPLRAIFEKIGAEVLWDGETSTITATKGDTEIKLTLNSTAAYKNGEEITLDVPAKSVNGRTLVPVRFIADCFGVDVKWMPEYQRVVLTEK